MKLTKKRKWAIAIIVTLIVLYVAAVTLHSAPKKEICINNDCVSAEGE